MIVLAVFTVALVRKVYNWGGGSGGGGHNRIFTLRRMKFILNQLAITRIYECLPPSQIIEPTLLGHLVAKVFKKLQ